MSSAGTGVLWVSPDRVMERTDALLHGPKSKNSTKVNMAGSQGTTLEEILFRNYIMNFGFYWDYEQF